MTNDNSFSPDDVDEWLSSSQPTLDEPEDLKVAIADLLAVIAANPPRRAVRRGHRRRLAAGVAVSVALAVTGVGAAAASGLWEWWAENPDLAYEFVLPSGELCEVRYGLMSTNPTTAPVDSSNLDPGLAQWLASTDVVQAADVDAALEAIEAGQVEFYVTRATDGGTSTLERVDPRVALDADGLYAAAVQHAVHELITDQLAARGLTAIAYAGQSTCAGGVQ